MIVTGTEKLQQHLGTHGILASEVTVMGSLQDITSVSPPTRRQWDPLHLHQSKNVSALPQVSLGDKTTPAGEPRCYKRGRNSCSRPMNEKAQQPRPVGWLSSRA